MPAEDEGHERCPCDQGRMHTSASPRRGTTATPGTGREDGNRTSTSADRSATQLLDMLDVVLARGALVGEREDR